MSIFFCCITAPPLILCRPDGYFRLPIRGECRYNQGAQENPRRYHLCQNNDDPEGQKEPDSQKPYPPDPTCIGNPQRTQCDCQNQGQTQNCQDFLHALRHWSSPLSLFPFSYFFTATGSTPGSITSSSTFFSFFNAMVVAVPMKLKKRMAAGLSCRRMMMAPIITKTQR